MIDRVFEDARSFKVSCGDRSVDVYVFADGDDVMITATAWLRWDSRRASFTMTAEKATLLKEFLIRKGY
jgi:hypothetical protein